MVFDTPTSMIDQLLLACYLMISSIRSSGRLGSFTFVLLGGAKKGVFLSS